ncbi:acyl-CoA dehydrogenase family protein [Natrialba sp. PRR66]|uniref:acyl-CoA dehydrogenase family protein n=1 Tax=Natrialba sp. PRR66 TaxID=3098146 RepID=UPI002B1E1763|nr:acyl-CoA dehydrogenase family protein [Natrialba sp. PRR66]
MDARLTEEQRRVQETAREFIDSEGGIELARRQLEGDDEVINELWGKLADLDYTAITVPLEYDGFGEGMVYLAALLETAGRYALPGPLPETAAVAVPLLTELGTEEQKSRYLPAIADGEVRMSVAAYDDATEPLPEGIRMRAERRESDDGAEFRMDGTKTLVPYGGDVDAVVVVARTRDARGYEGVSLFAIETDREAVEARRMDSLDWTRPVYELVFDDLTVGEEALLGPLHGGGTALSNAMERFTVAAMAMLTGAADRAVDRSVEHGNEREQYGYPIGRFQAVKHRIADMWLDMQSARSLVYYAAWALDNEKPDAGRAAAATKVFAADRLHRVFGDDIWNHGGMGFTWDHDAHIHLKQAKGWRNFLGSPEAYRERLLEARLAAESE